MYFSPIELLRSMKRFLLFLLSVSSLVASGQSPQAVLDYVEKYKNIAVEEMNSYGIPASVTLAQGIHESGCGMSVLALNSNNHFGIKCHNEWNGVKYHHDDDAPQECFRVYNCPEESFRDHSDFLKTRSRYAPLFKLEITDYRAWARGLKAAGYATNPHYPEIIIKLIEDFNLNKYDRPLSNNVAQGKQKDGNIPLTNATAQQAIQKEIEKQADLTKYSFVEMHINGTKAVAYKSSIPVAAIAQKYGLTTEQLYQFNDLHTKAPFKENEPVYVEQKKTETSYHQYEVAEGETMRDVAQKFGLSLDELYKRNGITAGCEPVAGEVVVLRGKREVPMRFKVVTRSQAVMPPATENKALDTKCHRVGDSDTLYSISKQYNVGVDTLIKINNLKDNDIKVGQTIIVSLEN